jgi:threonine dehydratase
VAGARDPWPWACPYRRDGDDIDHLIVPELDLAGLPLVTSDSENPFVRYRGGLTSYHLWRGVGRDDQSFVALVDDLDQRIARVAGHGFRRTPLASFSRLDDRIGAQVWVKDETTNVAGSHKGRHLFGVALLLAVLDAAGHDTPGDLVIASCGNAALAAAVIAAAAGRHLTAFVPTDADGRVVERLVALGAEVQRCDRDGEPGDPCYRRFRRAVAGGAIPFSCQGPANGFAIEGASTLAWEVAEARPEGMERVVVQVGGGALAAACVRGLEVSSGRAVFDTVQTDGAHPLQRAIVALRTRIDGGDTVDEALAEAAQHRGRFMWPWEHEPTSVARGILDDETYDWLALARAMLATGGTTVVANEAVLEEANDLARTTTGIDVDATGSAGLAGLLVLARTGRIGAEETVLVIFTGGGCGSWG